MRCTLLKILSILLFVGFLRSYIKGKISWWLTKQNISEANPCICIERPYQSQTPNHLTLDQSRLIMPPYSQWEPTQPGSGAVNPVKRVTVRTMVLKTVARTPIIDIFWSTPIYFFKMKIISRARAPTLRRTLMISPAYLMSYLWWCIATFPEVRRYPC